MVLRFSGILLVLNNEHIRQVVRYTDSVSCNGAGGFAKKVDEYAKQI
jgi:hypothetical protein